MQFALCEFATRKVLPDAMTNQPGASMSEEFSAKVRTLCAHEIYDLVRAGLVLAVTIGLALIVAPQMWG